MATYKVHHVALTVGVLDASLAFYASFGFHELFRWEADDESLTICHLGLSKGQPMLELFAYREAASGSTSAESLDADLKQLGVRHFALSVPSIASAYADVQAAGIIPDGPVRVGRTGISYFFVRDPDGNYVEVVQDDRGLLD
jgi:glyoxylase I family protein